MRWRKLAFNSLPFPDQLVLSWASYLSTLGLSFIVYEVGNDSAQHRSFLRLGKGWVMLMLVVVPGVEGSL